MTVSVFTAAMVINIPTIIDSSGYNNLIHIIMLLEFYCVKRAANPVDSHPLTSTALLPQTQKA